MGTAFWIRRFLVAFAGAVVVSAGVALLKGHSPEESDVHGLLWSMAAAALFTGVVFAATVSSLLLYIDHRPHRRA